MERLEVSIGSTLVRTVQLRDEAGDKVEHVYTGSEPLTLLLWAGEDQAAANIVASNAAWLDADGGTFTLRVDQSDTAGFVEGAYRGIVRILDGSDLLDCYEFWLDVTASPGSATPPPTYCTASEVRDVLSGWVGQLQDESDLAGFADARGEAREEFDRMLQRHYRGSRSSRQTTLDHLLTGSYPLRDGRDDATLQGWLDADGLILTGPTGQAARRWNAMFAASLVLDRQVGQGQTSPYQDLAARIRRRCEDLAATLMVVVDANGDGSGDIAIDLSVIDCLRN